MDNGDLESGQEENSIPVKIGRKYRPVVDNDSAVLEMSSMDRSGSPSSSSSMPVPRPPPKYVGFVRPCAFFVLDLDCVFMVLGLRVQFLYFFQF